MSQFDDETENKEFDLPHPGKLRNWAESINENFEDLDEFLEFIHASSIGLEDDKVPNVWAENASVENAPESDTDVARQAEIESVGGDVDGVQDNLDDHENETEAHGANGDIQGENDVSETVSDHADDANSHHAKNHAERHHQGSPDELDASDLSGSAGTEDQVLRTDGENATWGEGGGAGTDTLRLSPSDFEDFIESDNFETAIEGPLFWGSVVSSRPARDAVLGSELAMDAVSSSTIARDAVSDEDVMRNAVIADEMNSAKFLAGQATLDPSPYTEVDDVANDIDYDSETVMGAVADSRIAMRAVMDSQTGMDSVSASQTAMDSVMPDLMSRTKLLSSPYVIGTIWSSEISSTRVWEEGSPTPPHYSNPFDLKLTSASNGVGDALVVTNEDDPGVDGEGEWMWSLDIDFDNSDTLTLETQWQTTTSGGLMNMEIWVGGDVLYNVDASDSDFTWTERSFDVSEYSGTQTIEMGTVSNTSSGYSGVFEAFFDEIQLN